MNPVVLHPIIFYLFLFTAVVLFAYAITISFFYFKRWFQDIIIFLDYQNRFSLTYTDTSNIERIEHNDGSYLIKGITPPLNKKGKALFVFAEGNPKPLEIIHKEADVITAKTISSVINNKMVQILMSLQSSFMTMQFAMLACCVISAIASVLTALKMFGVIK